MLSRAFPHEFQFRRNPLSGAIRDCLIVDDDPVSRKALASQLCLLGVSVRAAGAAEQALDIWQNWKPPAVLIDCVLPGWDGYRLAQTIRALERQQSCRAATLLIAVSGRSDAAHWQRCEVSGMDGVLEKPARIDDYAHWLGLELPSRERVAPPVSSHEAELRCLYASSCESDLQAIFAALTARQHLRVSQHAHRIEGASLVLGAAEVARAASSLNAAVQANLDVIELAAHAAKLDRVYKQWQKLHPISNAAPGAAVHRR